MGSISRSQFMDKLFDYVIIIGLLVGLAFQCRISLQKYVSEQKTTVTNVRRMDKLRLPPITVCGGFRAEAMRSVGLIDGLPSYFQFYPEKDNVTESELLVWWSNITYSESDVIKDLTRKSVSGPGVFDVREFWSVSLGKCFLIHIREPMHSREYINLSMGLEEDQQINFYVHNDDQEYGVNYNCWPGNIEFSLIRPEQSKDILIRIKDFINDCSDESEEALAKADQEYAQCVFNFVHDNYMKGEGCKKVCWFPGGGVVAKVNTSEHAKEGTRAPIPHCATFEEEMCMQRIARKYVLLQDNVPESICPRSCREREYEVTYRHNPFFKRDRARLYVIMGSTDILQIQEIPLFDFNSILADVGGSLGLFIGFSFLSMFKSAKDSLVQRYSK